MGQFNDTHDREGGVEKCSNNNGIISLDETKPARQVPILHDLFKVIVS